MEESDRAPDPVTVFNRAAELKTLDRTRYLDEACGGNDSLRQEIESLLAEDERLLTETESSGEGSNLFSPLPFQFGPYEIRQRIGTGGMGSVYRAYNSRLDREQALKVLDSRALTSTGKDTLRKEAQTAASLNHPNIATIYTFESCDGHEFITMELVEGRSLRDQLKDGPLSVEQAITIASAVASAGEHAHAHGVVHRDLKPENIMIQAKDGDVKVLDFGIAKRLSLDSDLRMTSGALDAGRTTSRGTPTYMSPEQLGVSVVDGRTDIWALGCTLYECLVGETAVSSPGEPPEDWSVLRGRAPRVLTRLVQQCLRPDPIERPASMSVVLERLRAVSHPPRWPWMTAAALVVALTGTVVYALLLDPGPLARAVLRDPSTLEGIGENRGMTKWLWSIDEPISPNIKATGTGGDEVHRPFSIYHEEDKAVSVFVATYLLTGRSRLWNLDAKTGDPIWSRTATWEVLPNLHPDADPIYRMQNLINWSNGQTVLMATLMHGKWYPVGLEFLTHENELLGKYHHPGHLWFVDQINLFDDERGELLLYGNNSSARFIREIVPFEGGAQCGCVLALETPVGTGEGFPHSHPETRGRDWPELPKIHEAAYTLFPPLGPRFDARVTDLVVYEETNSIEAQCRDGRIYFLDSELRPMACYPSAGSLADSLVNVESIALPRILYVRNGEWEFIETPKGMP